MDLKVLWEFRVLLDLLDRKDLLEFKDLLEIQACKDQGETQGTRAHKARLESKDCRGCRAPSVLLVRQELRGYLVSMG